MRSYAIGDIHGHIELLHGAHERIAQDMARHGAAPIVHLGDLVDRGPDSRGVVDYLMRGVAAGKDWVVLKGNHDRLFTQYLRDPWWHDPAVRAELNWMHWKLGGAETLLSYGVQKAADRPVEQVHAEALQAVPVEHLAFLEACPTHLRRGDAFFVHAGVRPGVALADQIEDDLVWMRGAFLTETASYGPLIIHGHTAIDAPTHYGNRVNIDSSAAFGGPLTAIVVEGRDVFHLTDQGRVPLLPQA